MPAEYTEYGAGERVPSFIESLKYWTIQNDVMPEDMGRIVAVIVSFIMVCYLVMLVARFVLAIIFPTLLVLSLIMICRFASPQYMSDGLKAISDGFLSVIYKCFEHFPDAIP